LLVVEAGEPGASPVVVVVAVVTVAVSQEKILAVVVLPNPKLQYLGLLL
jgi:hypothetical protein